jgi:hypothetical protein
MALGFVIATIVYIGFTVHLFGACAILIGIFPGMRANLAEAAILRARAASYEFRLYLDRADAPAATSQL